MKPQAKFAMFYFAINMCNGVTLAFFPLHAKFLGFSAMEIAISSAAANVATMLGAPLFTFLSFRFLAAKKLFRIASVFACIFYFPLLFTTNFHLVLFYWFAFLISYSAISVLTDTLALRESAIGHIRFEKARIWGSLGFVLSLALTGKIIDVFGLNAIIKSGFCFTVLTNLTSFLILNRMSDSPGVRAEKNINSHTNLRVALKPLIFLIITVALSWASHGAYYVYFSIYLKSLAWSGSEISIAWNVGVVAEIILFAYFRELLRHISILSLLRLSLVLTILRWLILASTSHSLTLVLVQTLHAFSFGALFLCSIRLVYEICPENYRERGQGFLSGLGIGAGSLFGRLLFGYLAVQIPESENLYQLFWPASALAFLGLMASFCVRSKLIE